MLKPPIMFSFFRPPDTQVVVKFCDLVWPKDFKTAEEFSAAVEAGVRKGYAEIALAECDEPESPAAKKCQ